MLNTGAGFPADPHERQAQSARPLDEWTVFVYLYLLRLENLPSSVAAAQIFAGAVSNEPGRRMGRLAAPLP